MTGENTAKMRPAENEGDHTYRDLVEQVVSGDEQAWSTFVHQFSNLLFSLLWRYANGDQDRCSDLYLYVIEGLKKSNERGESFYRFRRYLQSIKRYHGRGRLTTWLGRVTQNLVSDYFREREGRRTLPRAIQRLDLSAQKMFKLLYWDCLSERETFETMRSENPRLGRAEFDDNLYEINRLLKKSNRWSLYSEVIRRTPALPLLPGPADRPDRQAQVQVADPHPDTQPSVAVIEGEQQATARSMGRALRALIAEMDESSRLVLLCRFRHGMTAKEIAKVVKQTDQKRIYTDIDKIVGHLKHSLGQAGFEWDAVCGGIGAIDGLLDEFDQADSDQDHVFPGNGNPFPSK
jgi:RNA polymerase sigma factor (sigma-70 family)